MTRQKIDAQRITKPIQLLAAWLIGLVLVDGSFLATALSLGVGWERSILVVAAVLNVPGFLFAIFLLQTKFRPELQEDAFYSEYISRKTNTSIEVNKIDVVISKISDLQNELLSQQPVAPAIENHASSVTLDWSNWKISLNTNLPFFSDLKKALNDSNIPVASVFGKGDAPLTTILASISDEMDSDHALAILKIIAKFPIDKFDFWSPIIDAGEDEDVYIGAYGPHQNAITLTQAVRSAVSDARDRADLLKLGTQ